MITHAKKATLLSWHSPLQGTINNKFSQQMMGGASIYVFVYICIIRGGVISIYLHISGGSFIYIYIYIYTYCIRGALPPVTLGIHFFTIHIHIFTFRYSAIKHYSKGWFLSPSVSMHYVEGEVALHLHVYIYICVHYRGSSICIYIYDILHNIYICAL